ncbi:MAG: transglycosylase SLT domain-containing protein [Burkholderiales bacterium]
MNSPSFSFAHFTRTLGGTLLAVLLSGCAATLPIPESERTPAQLTPPAVQTPDRAPSPPAPVTSSAKPSEDLPAIKQVDLKPNAVLGLQAHFDIWERIRMGFAMPDLDNDLVRNREVWYASRPDYFLRMTERSRPYIFYIVEELERRKMPTELALLPFIESAFNPQAVSSAKAAGMWQFMPATGKYFDLKQNLFRDERRDVLESTRAALDYLQKLYNMFGDWHLALAAYTWGEGSVGRALARNRAQGKPLTYSELRMPDETRYYVPKLQAVKNIIAQPDSFKTVLPLIQNHPFFKSVPINKDIDVELAAKMANVSLKDFKALNPAMNRPVILAAGTPLILLPWDNATMFENNLQSNSDGRLSSWTAWQAPRTMKAEEVAKEVGMTAEKLRAVNGIPPRMLVKAGSTLLVPRPSQKDSNVAEHLADNGRLLLAPEVVLRKIFVTARQGDNMALLAARHGVTAANLATWNDLQTNSKLTAGKKLAVFVPSKESRRLSKAPPGPQAAGKSRPKAQSGKPAKRSDKPARKPAPRVAQR